MQAGRLDQRVRIERHEYLDQDPITGEEIRAWVEVATCWAAVEPLNGREFFAAATTMSEVEAKIRMRYRPGLSTADRINHEGTVYDIVAVINPRSGDRELVLMCKASAA